MTRFLLLMWLPVWMVAVSAYAGEPLAYANARATSNPTALDRYVAKPDPNFSWTLVKTEKEEGLTLYTIAMTSQQWRTAQEVSRPIWKHTVIICVPDEVLHTTGLLYIEGGFDWGDGSIPGMWGVFKTIARNTKSITAEIYNVPNQPLVFYDMKSWPRFEDSLIAYTWDKFFRTGDDEWPLRLPMTKAAVRAMDTVQAFCASDAGGKHTVKDFAVTGVSKRGWTAWTTAIVDKRVVAIAPCSIDPMHVIEACRYHWEVYGRWSAAFGDYVAMRVTDWIDTPENAALMAFEDPSNYLDRLTMPKFILLGANDQFMVPESTGASWDKMQGEKWLRYSPNAGHALNDTAVPSVEAFYAAFVNGTPIPEYSFSFEEDGSIVVKLEPSSNGAIIQPESVKLWQAYNPKKRDVRGANATFEPTELQESAPGVYRANVEQRTPGYVVYLVELTYPGPTPDLPFRFTTGCRVTPQERPFKYTPPENLPKGFLSGEKLTME